MAVELLKDKGGAGPVTVLAMQIESPLPPSLPVPCFKILMKNAWPPHQDC